jgi:hypothetical protein
MAIKPLETSKNELYRIGFELLLYLSARISNESEEDEYYEHLLQPILHYFESLPQSWS